MSLAPRAQAGLEHLLHEGGDVLLATERFRRLRLRLRGGAAVGGGERAVEIAPAAGARFDVAAGQRTQLIEGEHVERILDRHREGLADPEQRQRAAAAGHLGRHQGKNFPVDGIVGQIHHRDGEVLLVELEEGVLVHESLVEQHLAEVLPGASLVRKGLLQLGFRDQAALEQSLPEGLRATDRHAIPPWEARRAFARVRHGPGGAALLPGRQVCRGHARAAGKARGHPRRQPRAPTPKPKRSPIPDTCGVRARRPPWASADHAFPGRGPGPELIRRLETSRIHHGELAFLFVTRGAARRPAARFAVSTAARG